MKDFLEDNKWIVHAAALALGIILCIVILIVDARLPYDQYQKTLYEYEQTFDGDMNNLKQLKNVKVEISRDEVKITFKERYSLLTLTYDKTGCLKTKTMTNIKLTNNLVYILFTYVVSAAICWLFLWPVYGILWLITWAVYKIRKRRNTLKS